jgi:hemerythrin
MALVNWSTDYSVGVNSIDKQHQILFDMLNNLHDAMKTGKGSKLAPTILKNLVQYTREHFANEEKLMSQAAYADFAGHKAEHDKLTGEVLQIVQDSEAGKLVLSMKLQDFLRNWLQAHILGSDKKYTASLQAAGVR